jgi:transcription elongation factor SPT5
MDGSRTSNPYDGSRTAYGSNAFSGGRTPAWNSGARTPYDSGVGSSGSSGFDAFAAGSRTPAWGASMGGRTPASWNSQLSSAPSPASSKDHRSYDAPTPGGDYSAPTPGAYGSAPTPSVSASTPRGWADAPTPGALNAPTPVGYGGGRPYDAPTPAIGSGAAGTPEAGDDGGPHYEEGTP